MNAHDLLERRAERGNPRGAANVWADANVDALRQTRRSNGAWTFRLVLLAWIVGIGVAAVMAESQGQSVDTAQSSAEFESFESAEPLPEPILVEGMSLEWVSRPINDDWDADDLFGETNDVTLPDFVGQSRSYAVFAHPEDPFTNSIHVLELFESGGFQVRSANSDSPPEVIQIEGEWTLPIESGLVEVDRITESPDRLLAFGWQFNFAAGAQEVVVQAEAGSQWQWIARQLDDDATTRIRPIEVLGSPGYVIVDERQEGADEVIWSEGDFVYRLLASTTEGDRSIPQLSSESIDRLLLAERVEWVEAVRAVDLGSPAGSISLLLGLVLAGALILSLLVFGFRRHAKSAVLVFATLGFLYIFGSANAGGGPTASTLLLAAAGLAIAWWATRFSHNTNL